MSRVCNYVIIIFTAFDAKRVSLRRFIDTNNGNINSEKQQREINLQFEQFGIFANKPFWISDIEEHKKADIANDGNCCFNHVVGLPKKDGIYKPIFDYEMQLINTLDNDAGRISSLSTPKGAVGIL
jgi:hypothetical protein